MNESIFLHFGDADGAVETGRLIFFIKGRLICHIYHNPENVFNKWELYSIKRGSWFILTLCVEFLDIGRELLSFLID